MKSFPTLGFFLLGIILYSCSNSSEYTPMGDEIQEDDIINQVDFTEEELIILNQTLHLPDTLLNYANPDLPAHYTGSDANESDNTPFDNFITDYGATLGRVLFFDRNLSANNTIACASCHHQVKGFSDDAQFSIGLNGETTRRNSMTLINGSYYENGHFFWDERAETLEQQVLMPIVDHVEMGMELEALEQKLQALDYYQILFNKEFGDSQVTSNRIARALAQFTRSIVSTDSKFDQGLAMVWPVENEEEMPDFPNFTEQENLGIDIFFRGRKGGTCLYCHGTPQIVNDAAKNNGLALEYLDNGKGEITGDPNDNATFKVPSLRNIAKTAPYMHDGRFETLMDVVNHYSEGVQDHPNLHFRLKTLDDGAEGEAEVLHLNLTQEEKEALVAFLNTLTDDTLATKEKYSNPFN